MPVCVCGHSFMLIKLHNSVDFQWIFFFFYIFLSFFLIENFYHILPLSWSRDLYYPLVFIQHLHSRRLSVITYGLAFSRRASVCQILNFHSFTVWGFLSVTLYNCVPERPAPTYRWECKRAARGAAGHIPFVKLLYRSLTPAVSMLKHSWAWCWILGCPDASAWKVLRYRSMHWVNDF